jgi:acetyltransferase-like isoleucine patch superfamily enzyme
LINNSFYSFREMKKMGFMSLGRDVSISRKASLYSPSSISIGSNVRIDDFCILSGKIEINDYIHISAGVYIFAGNAGVVLGDFSGLSSRVVVYAVTDDYSGNALTNSTIDNEYRNVISGPVSIGRHVVVGTGTTILPNVNIGDYSAIGAMSLVNKSIDRFSIAVGIPCKTIKRRSDKILALEAEFRRRTERN